MAIPGLPALAAGIIFNAVEIVASDVMSLLGLFSGPQWGLFQDGLPVVAADNVLSFDFRQDFRISDYPVEEGAFETYNKVQVPYDVRLQFSSGGSVAQRQELIDSVDAIIGSTDTFDAVTPEKTYLSINPVHQSIRRTSRSGLGLVVIDVYCREIRVTATPEFSNSTDQQSQTSGSTTDIKVIPGSQIRQPKAASAAPQVSLGTVQTSPSAPGQFDISQALP